MQYKAADGIRGFSLDLTLTGTMPGLATQLTDWLRTRLRQRFRALPAKDTLGNRGESAAARHLQRQGYKILIRNWRCDLGEIDIIARDGKTLVFVEVKTRLYDDPTPEEQINAVKQHQITKSAKLYLSRYGFPQPPARFDIVAVIWPTGREPQVRHTPNAFEATF